MEVGVVGGTGREGFGLALRLASAGHRVTIGSRDEERGRRAAQRLRERLGDVPAEGALNERAVRSAEIVFVTVPFVGQADVYRAIRPHLPEEVVVVDTTCPLATSVGGRAWQVVRPWHGSAAEQASAILRGRGHLVSGFHSVAARALQHVERAIEGDVLLSGHDRDAKELVGGLVEQIPHLRWVDVGDLSMARVIEPLTAMLISVNRIYRADEATLRLVGDEDWGRPGTRA